MFKFEFTVSSNLIHRYTLSISFVALLLTFFKLTNAINYLGATYAIGSILMRKRDHLRNAIAISGTGCAYDFLYVIFYSSKSSSASVRFVSFAVRILAFLFEVLWTMSVYLYLKQQIALKAAMELNRKKKKRVTWCDDQINARPCRRVSLGAVKTFVKTGMDMVQSGAKSLQSAKPEVVRQLTKLKNAAMPAKSAAEPATPAAESARPAGQMRPARRTRPARPARRTGLTIADLLSTFGGAPRRSAVRPASGSRDVRRSFAETPAAAASANADQPIAEAADANQPIVRAAFVDQPIVKSAFVDQPIAKSTFVDQLIAESANVDRLIAKSMNLDRSIAKSAANVDRSIEGTTVVDLPIAESAANVDLPIAESVTAESAANVDLPTAESGVVDQPTAESGVVDQPIAERVTAETENNKMTESGRPDGTLDTAGAKDGGQIAAKSWDSSDTDSFGTDSFGTDFSDTDLSDTDFSDTDLSDTDSSDTDSTGSDETVRSGGEKKKTPEEK